MPDVASSLHVSLPLLISSLGAGKLRHIQVGEITRMRAMHGET